MITLQSFRDKLWADLKIWYKKVGFQNALMQAFVAVVLIVVFVKVMITLLL